MPFTVRSNLPNLGDLELLSPADWRAIGEEAKLRIIQRTRRGLDVDGGTFEPYSEGYIQAKQEYGVNTGTVNLTVTGAMLDTLGVIEVTKHSVTLGWTQ